MARAAVLVVGFFAVGAKAMNSSDWADCLTISETVPGDVDLANNKTCYEDLVWAKTVGVKQNPSWYPGLNENSSIYQFQEAVYEMKGPLTNGTSWSCPKPCAEAPIAGPMGAVSPPSTGSSSSNLPWWAWLLLLLCCCAPLIGLACAFFLCYETVAFLCPSSEKKRPKKKRAIKVAAPVAAPEPEPVTRAMAPVSTVSAPMPVYQPVQMAAPVAPAVTTAAPVYMEAARAQPVTYAAPQAMSYAAPQAMSYVAPQVQSYAAPQVQSYAAPQAMSYAAPMSMAQPTYATGSMAMAQPVSLFDQLDTNHDGSIGRAELAAMQR